MSESSFGLSTLPKELAASANCSWDECQARFHDDIDGLPLASLKRIGLQAMTCGATVILASLPISLVGMHIGFALLALGVLLARPPIHRFPGFWFGVGMSVWIVLSVGEAMWSAGSPKAMMHWGVVYTWLSLPCASVAFHAARTRTRALRLLSFALLAAGIMAMAQYFVGYDSGIKPWHMTPDPRHRFERTSGFLGGVLTYGVASALTGVLLITRPVTEGLSVTQRWIGRGGSLLGLIFSCARLAMLGFGAGICVSLASRRWRRGWVGVGAVLAGILAVGGISFATLTIIRPKKLITMERLEDPRWRVWNLSIGVIEKNPVFGIGGRQRFQAECKKQLKRMRAADPKLPKLDVTHAHNNLLVLASEHGIPAAGLHLAFLFAIIRYFYRRRSQDHERFGLALALIVTWMVAGQFNNLISQSETAYALYACLAFAFSMRAGQQQLKEIPR